MSEVTVRAIQPVLNLSIGDVVTVERTERVDAAIKGGHLAVIEPEKTEVESPRTNRVKKLAGIDDETTPED